MAENRTYNDSPSFIPARLESSVHGLNPVADAKDIYDINHDKWQKDINDEIEAVPVEIKRINDELSNRYTKSETYSKTEVDTKESSLQGQINTIKGGSTKSIATIDNEINGNNGIDERLQTVEALGEISVGGGDIQIATGADFDDPDATQKAKAVTVGAVLGGIINTPVFDLTAYTGDTYADLEAALAVMSDVSFLTQLKKGGMRFQYVSSIDNKYVQFRSKTQSFSTNPEDWYFESKDTLIDNPEYSKAIRDSAGHLLCWIRKKDGGIDWAVGVPKPVKDYIEKQIESKVDKKEGFSLIDADFASTHYTTENNEWLYVIRDNEGRILEGIKKNGCRYVAPFNNLFGTYDAENFKYGGIDYSGEYTSSEDYIRNTKLVKIKAGTILVPYVFGRYKIAFYDDYNNFIKLLPAEGGGQHDTGWFDQNAYEFTEDCNVRFVLGWMSPANFYTGEGYENIIPNNNVISNILCKFRLIEPGKELPYYISHAIDNVQHDILSKANMFTFTFIADPHEYYYHEDAAVYCANKTSRMLLNCGDLLSWPETGVEPAIKTLSRHVNSLLKCKVPVLMSRGNHEMSKTYDSEGNVYNRDIWYNQAQLPFRRDNFVYNVNDRNGGYFYVDDELYKVRVICLNMHIDVAGHSITDKQRRWLSTIALDLSSKGNDESNWAVIAFGHCQILDNIDTTETTATREERWIADMFKAAYNKTAPEFINPEWDDMYDVWCNLIPTINVDFSNIQYQFIGYIHGHCHYDNVSTEKDFVHITTTCAHPLENEDYYRRDFDTPNEYAFDIVSIDKENRKLYLKRIGVGSNREISY